VRTVRRGLVGHSAIYGIAQVAQAAASIALLPVYTASLQPRDFGMVAVLELCMTVVAGLAGTGVGSAATRLHFRPEHAGAEHRVWTTGLVALLAQASLLLAVGSLSRRPLAAALFGAGVADGVAVVGPMLLLMLVNLVGNYGFAYLRATERSVVFLWVTLGGLALRVGFNLWLLVGLRLGVAGYLASGVLAGGAQAIVLLVLLFGRRPMRFDRAIWCELAAFAWPIAIASLAALAMHQADLWLLRWLQGDLGQIGLYAFAYAIVQRSNGLLLTPFSSIWGARLYQLDSKPERSTAYRRAFRGYTLISGAALLALALCAEPLVDLVAGDAYLPAAGLVPILCAGFFLFSLHSFFAVPALLAGRSRTIAANAVTAAATNVALGLLLIPVAGIEGAAIASLVTYGVYSFGGYLRYRRVERLRWPLEHLAKLAAVAIATWATLPLLPLHPASPWLALAVSGAWALLAGGVMLLACGRDLVAAQTRRLWGLRAAEDGTAASSS
jgi:O-antigen/teichoic acid export membrane protein